MIQTNYDGQFMICLYMCVSTWGSRKFYMTIDVKYQNFESVQCNESNGVI